MRHAPCVLRASESAPGRQRSELWDLWGLLTPVACVLWFLAQHATACVSCPLLANIGLHACLGCSKRAVPEVRRVS